ncbi:beta-glucanase/beta-glucan synthetase [Paenibacillus paeoniae]|uniref:Beta-glucanase/beta-glucan synthetase n=1 Tax=Paenibacillus paeoniae TaxID=2292705 RepID=A0A371PN42_9BACL|nr:beta-glucanase/beta-glucan synthetase [Paenibacillus paeoniae]REK77630.1 beta-glucanase/beta-glucan synthetase [Paenibacillus paeoniae]
MGKFWVHKLLAFIIVVALAAGCSVTNHSINVDDSTEITTDTDHNPFNTDEKNTVVMGTMSHSFENLNFNEKGQALPLQYNGGELSVDYSVTASGKAKNVGFFIFVDGIPQPYKINTTDAPYEYMHIFELIEDDKEMPFTFVFTPVAGKKGETLHVSVSSIYNPGFRPDMKETSSYGGYHETLESGISLVFNQDVEETDFTSIVSQEVISKAELSTEPVTKELLEKYSSSKGLDMAAIGKRIFTELHVENEVRNQYFQVNKNGVLHVAFKMFGHPGVRYKNTFYINHNALTSSDSSSFETAIAEGNVSVVKAEIKLDNLEDFSTFYVVSVPMNADDFPNDAILLSKTPSLLLYK